MTLCSAQNLPKSEQNFGRSHEASQVEQSCKSINHALRMEKWEATHPGFVRYKRTGFFCSRLYYQQKTLLFEPWEPGQATLCSVSVRTLVFNTVCSVFVKTTSLSFSYVYVHLVFFSINFCKKYFVLNFVLKWTVWTSCSCRVVLEEYSCVRVRVRVETEKLRVVLRTYFRRTQTSSCNVWYLFTRLAWIRFCFCTNIARVVVIFVKMSSLFYMIVTRSCGL